MNSQNNFSTMDQEIKQLIATIDGDAGVFALHPKSGFTYEHQADKFFFMASTYKIPMAMYFLHQAAMGLLGLENFISIQSTDIRPSTVHSKWINQLQLPGLQLSCANLIRLMMIYSDNTATDIILRLLGGPAAVTDYVRSLGINDMRINRSVLRILADQAGITNLPPNEACTLSQFEQLEKAVTETVRMNALKKFGKDGFDQGTPRAMVTLLNKLEQPAMLQHQHIKFLLDCMQSCQTGLKRIRGKLPAFARCADKTGTRHLHQ